MSNVKTLFQQFFDSDGAPLDAGFIYVGTSGQNPETNPITVYWDAALTQPAAQPLRTLNGCISRNGTPADVFTDAAHSDYSITVRNRNGGLVYSKLSAHSLADFQSDLAAAIHAAPLDADPSELDEIGIWDSVTGLLRKITFTFLQSGAGAVLMTLRRALRLSIWVEHYGGGPTATAAVNNAAFAAAIAEAFARGGDIVNFGPGSWPISATINLKAKVFLQGRGSTVSEIFLANGSNCDVLNTEGFAGQTLQNLWLVSEGVLTGFGFDGIRFNGNRLNQISGNGVRIYGKRYYIGYDVQIINSKDVGFYSECAFKGGEAVPEDQPEGYIGKIQVWKSGKENIIYRGPHDQPIGDLYCAYSGLDAVAPGMLFDGKTNVYQGITYVNGTVHSYASNGPGVVCQTQMMFNKLSGEHNVQSGVILEDANANWIGAFYTNINYLEGYGNDSNASGLYWNFENRVLGTNVGLVRHSTSFATAGSIKNTGHGLTIAAGVVNCAGAANGTAFNNAADFANVNLKIYNADKLGDVGFESGAGNFCNYHIKLFNCSTLAWKNTGNTFYNHYDVNAAQAAGVAFTQTGSFSGSDTFDVKLVVGGVAAVSKYNDIQRAILNGAVVATVTHNAFKAPTVGQITITPNMNWSNAGVARTWWISNITATTFDINVDVAAPVGGLTFFWKLDI